MTPFKKCSLFFYACTASESQETPTALTGPSNTLRAPLGPQKATNRSRVRIAHAPHSDRRSAWAAPSRLQSEE